VTASCDIIRGSSRTTRGLGPLAEVALAGFRGRVTEAVTAGMLILVPVAFNVAFSELGRAFDYPNIMRKAHAAAAGTAAAMGRLA
jgi:hypothetical protein